MKEKMPVEICIDNDGIWLSITPEEYLSNYGHLMNPSKEGPEKRCKDCWHPAKFMRPGGHQPNPHFEHAPFGPKCDWNFATCRQ